MSTLPTGFAHLIAAFAPLFSQRMFQSVQALLLAAILAIGKRTITAVLRFMFLFCALLRAAVSEFGITCVAGLSSPLIYRWHVRCFFEKKTTATTTPFREDAVLGNFIRLFFRQQKDNQAGELPPQGQGVQERHVPPADMRELPDISAACWRRLMVGEMEIMTADIPLRFLLKNNVRYVKRAGGSEEAIAERIRITYSFFIKNRPLLDAEIKMLGRIEGEGA